jgi:2-polyprenyl-3-methyl-5-hydroxy-6-metoxy-1,4-benzoquinol methylase
MENEKVLSVTPLIENITGAFVEIEHEFIDVKQLIATLTDEELLKSADEYWDSKNLESGECYKPFSNSVEPVFINRHLSMLFQAADLFPGAKVLDFGCATGWLTLGMAEMGMIASGVDISPKAIQLAEEFLVHRGLRPNSVASYNVYKGNILPYEDASFDRIVCFDAFHHVRDQEATLREMARILRPGGRIAMCEPGPDHSKSPVSQGEMRKFNVIENDIDMLEIDEICQNLGLRSPMMICQFSQPVVLPVVAHKAWVATAHSPAVEKEMYESLKNNLVGEQCFFLDKPLWTVDSRKSDVLGGEVQLLATVQNSTNDREYIFELQLTNSGQAVWLAKPHQLGQVQLGIQLMNKNGTTKDLNAGRVSLPSGDVQPGASVKISVKVRLPVTMKRREYLRFDLVAENVAWFSDVGKGVALEWHP